MYPKLASVTTECKICSGEGKYMNGVGDTATEIKCTDCNGTGKVIPISRDGVLGMPQYIDEGKTPYPGSPASYITPDNASLVTAMDDLRELGKDILYSATGDKNLITETLNTATENLINFKGLEDRIAEIVEMVESREEFIIKTTAKMHLDFTDAIKSCSVRYGRRLVIRGESEIIAEIKTSKESGMPISHIEMLQRELIYTRYKNNKVELERQQLLADVEPLNGYTVQEALSMAAFVDDLKIKFNFNRLTDMFEAQKGKIEMYKPDMDWKKRVIDIYNQYKLLSDEILPVEGDSGQD
jgi:predicted RNA-binding protein with EMAP domain